MSTPLRRPPNVNTSFNPPDQKQVSPLDSVNSISHRPDLDYEDDFDEKTPNSVTSSGSSGLLKAKAKSIIEVNKVDRESGVHFADAKDHSPHSPRQASATTPRQQRRHTENKRFFDADHASPVLITQQAMMRLKEQIDDTDSYFNLVQFIIFLILYMLVLYNQVGVNSGSRELKMRYVVPAFFYFICSNSPPNPPHSIRTRLFSEGGAISDWITAGGEEVRSCEERSESCKYYNYVCNESP